MPRFYLRLALLPTILLTVVLIGIRSQPYDDHELHELLLPTGCAAPCFMGIQAGITTVEEAVKLLEASGWVEEILGNRELYKTWKWNGHQPQYIDSRIPIILSFSTSSSGLVVVQTIEISTHISVGSIMILMDKPTSSIVISGQSMSDGSQATYAALWFGKIRIDTYTPCPPWMRKFSFQKADITFFDFGDNWAYPGWAWDANSFRQMVKNPSFCNS